MGRCALCLIGFISAVLVYGQTPAPKVCWDSTWYNSSAPTASNRSEYEHQPTRVLDTICIERNMIAAQCRDNKGEPFQDIKNDTISKYIATCTYYNGLICHPYNNSKDNCPDFEIQYGCACPSNSSAGVTSVPSVTSADRKPDRSSSDSSSGSGTGGTGINQKGEGATVSTGVTGSSGQQHGKCRSGVPKYGISLFMLTLCLVLK